MLYSPCLLSLGFPEQFCRFIGTRDGAVVRRVRRRLVHLVRIGDHRCDGKSGNGCEVAAEARLLRGTVEGEPLADKHEILLACLAHDGPHVGDGGVVVVTDDFASVDATLRVAPGDHGFGCVANFLVESGNP